MKHASKPSRRPLRILFVCVENANRSQMAEGFARRIGEGRVEVFSAGSNPSGTVNPRAIEAMGERGIDLSDQRSKSIGEVADVEFDAVVTLANGEDLSGVRARTREIWSIPDPRDMLPEEFRGVRDLIEASVKGLIGRLEGS